MGCKGAKTICNINNASGPGTANKCTVPHSSVGRESNCNSGDPGSIPGLGRRPVEGNATHSSILAWRIPMDRGAWQAIVHGVTVRQT